ncbi:MAG TPA: hypothetical protein VL588_03030, partial [Bdellovibrionota bacterium]|nr:hypothetical protein [Bdellovibrionota bacterium]
MKAIRILLISALSGLATAAIGAHAGEPYSPDYASVELHAHLFMKEGVPLLAHGDFFGEIES